MVNKLLIVLLIFICFLFPACSAKEKEEQTEETQPAQVQQEQIRAMWLSCYELMPMFSQGTEEYFCAQVTELLETCYINGINTLFVQVRPFCDALYPSNLFDWSEFALSSSGVTPCFDPLEIIISCAKEYDVDIHAWVNPYRVSYDADCSVSQEISDFTFVCEQGIYLEPSDIRSQKLVLDGVREILENYNVSGIHIDDYFYPLTDENFDQTQFEVYKKQGGKLNKKNWRRENVNSLVSAMYSLVHSINSDAVFSISPAADISKNKDRYYADIEVWISQAGYADWIIPQIYFGFEHETMPFEKIASEWIELAENSHVKLVCGLASYKTGLQDKAAGNGVDEWKNNANVIIRQIELIEKLGYDGYALFSYSAVNSL